MSEKIRFRRIDKIFSLCVILLPFLHQYRGIISLISFGEMLLLPFAVYYFITDFNRLKCERSLFILYVIAMTSMVVMSFSEYFVMADAISLFVRLVFYAIVILTGRCHFNYSAVRNIYKIFVVLMAVYLLTQYIYHIITDGYLPIYLKYEWLFDAEKRGENLAEFYKWSFRPSGLFLEPSYYALFSLPALVDMVMGKNKDYISFAIVCISFLVSMAMSGIVGVAIIIMFCYADVLKEKNNKKYLFLFGFLLLISIACTTEIFSKAMDRLMSGGSIHERITRGIIAYDMLPLINKIFGVGLNNLGNYMSYFGLTTGYDQTSLNYCCTILQCLNFSGVFALIALCTFIVTIYKRSKTMICKCLVAVLLFIMCYESILYSYRFAFYLLLVYSWHKEFKNETNQKI